MTITKDHIGGLVFLCLSVVYGYQATQIRMLPGDEYLSFNAQTLPIALAFFGGILSLALLVLSPREQGNKLVLAGLDFPVVGALLVLIMVFAFALNWLGFLLSTVLFLVMGFWILGERRIKILFIASVPFAVVIWFSLSQLLEIYLAPGRLFTSLFGA